MACSTFSPFIFALAANTIIILLGQVVDIKLVFDYLVGTSKFIQIPLFIFFVITLLIIEHKYVNKYFKKRLPAIKKRYLNYKPNFFVRFSVVGLGFIVFMASIFSIPFTIYWVNSWHVN